jgi:homoserine kinase
MTNACQVHVPATSANLGVGFDTFGLALNLWNTFHIKRMPEGEAPSLHTLEGSTFSIGPKLGWDAVGGNIFFQALAFYYEHIKRPLPAYEVGAFIQIPVARGLGSSATAVVAALMGANALEGSPLDEDALLKLAIAFEGHPDNVAPAMRGGCVFGDANHIYSLQWPKAWALAVWMPEDPLLTEAARHVLPKAYERSEVVTAIRNASAFLYAVEHERSDVLRRVIEQDVIHEPYRKNLIEGFDAFRAYIHAQTEALGVVISGSGSTCLVIFEDTHQASVMQALQQWQHQWGGSVAHTPLEIQGARLELL